MDKLRLDHPASRKGRRFSGLVAMAIVLAVGAGMPSIARADASADMGVFVGYPPPPLPLDDQSPIPGPGYIWIPGYWAWSEDGYYWVPGYWELPPFVGALWTPGYWGWFGRVCIFHRGFWARHVGFYGGINYGSGYPGKGYTGGRWGAGGFYYNRSVNRINDPRITNVYGGAAANNGALVRTSFNGGQGGVTARPSVQDEAVAREAHVAPVATQIQHVTAASQNPSMRTSANHGAPLVVAAPASATDGLGAASTRGVTGQAARLSVNSQRTLPQVPVFRRGMVLSTAGSVPYASSTSRSSVARVAGGFSSGANGATSYTRTVPGYANRPMSGPVAYRMPAVHATPANHPVQAAGGGHAYAGGHH
ncbi:YXWGXW repeat-containing protein [Dyella humicola]|uniref:YXWGXW repeat-containing protein n=1 Tax=Dyella humicola TaxID=2992126 RepID=UPI0022573BAB|nr:YXWGXW repeat-containing protein [Dyella humicola]